MKNCTVETWKNVLDVMEFSSIISPRNCFLCLVLGYVLFLNFLHFSKVLKQSNSVNVQKAKHQICLDELS